MKYLTFLALAIASLVVAAALPNTLSRPLDISSMISGPKSLSDVVPLAHFDKKIELGNLRGECEPRLHCPLPRPTYPERLCERWDSAHGRLRGVSTLRFLTAT
ncbi:hypothetical protein E4T38_09612 [Aureobasidium subglaciale]|nr:hypothetical protein E4T38_09612 [Aureobasidium subglaciale]KAI5213685.1 hypothetical protein E4T40_09554 [Aureobasidium subglaciale]KAI5215473.1 hypothetical protein E4T41_09592 [Aureobasidium subglaciale]KAI5253353.1 hypothetical protein E4T46_09546 [Aureobasidium subglaciale]